MYTLHKTRDFYAVKSTYFQVLGVTLDTVSFAENILTTEFNSATDNPLVFLQKDGQPGDHDIISAGTLLFSLTAWFYLLTENDASRQ